MKKNEHRTIRKHINYHKGEYFVQYDIAIQGHFCFGIWLVASIYNGFYVSRVGPEIHEPMQHFNSFYDMRGLWSYPEIELINAIERDLTILIQQN